MRTTMVASTDDPNQNLNLWDGATFSSDKLVFLSDGLCGSTCSVVSSFALMHRLARGMVIGGIGDSNYAHEVKGLLNFTQGNPSSPAVQSQLYGGNSNYPQQFWSFPGGEVEQIEFIQEMIQFYGIDPSQPPFDKLVPSLLPDNATFRFAIREIYPWNSYTFELPLEYLYVPAAFHSLCPASEPGSTLVNCANSSLVYPLAVRTALTDSVGPSAATCYPVGGQPCMTANGRGLFQCGNCVVVDCIPGFFLSDGQCQECPSGTYRSEGSAEILSCSACPVPEVPSFCSLEFTNNPQTSSTCSFRVSCSKAATVGVPIGAAIGGALFALAAVWIYKKYHTESKSGDSQYSSL